MARARGAFGCIGATTTDEYRRIFEHDRALDRRFQPVTVGEPSPAETVRILDGLLRDLERSHLVHIPATILSVAVELADRFVRDRKRPDMVIDLVDEAAADLNLSPNLADPLAARETAARREAT